MTLKLAVRSNRMALAVALAVAGLVAQTASAAAPAYVTDILSGVADGKDAGLSIIAALAGVLVIGIVWGIVKRFKR